MSLLESYFLNLFRPPPFCFLAATAAKAATPSEGVVLSRHFSTPSEGVGCHVLCISCVQCLQRRYRCCSAFPLLRKELCFPAIFPLLPKECLSLKKVDTFGHKEKHQ